MILFVARATRVVLVLAILFGNWWLFRGKLSPKKRIFASLMVILVALIANYTSQRLLPVTDQVTLTALGEKNGEAISSEIYLSGYTIDGNEYICGTDLKIESGHWFWSGENYAWRPETDSRQPGGMTRTVVLRIPVGWSRTLDFSGNIYRGIVEVTIGGESRVVNTYSQDDIPVKVNLGRSKTFALILNQIRYLTVYAIILLTYGIASTQLVRVALHNPKRTQEWLKKNSGKLTYGTIAIISFCLMFHYAERFSFWIDELGQIAFTKGTLSAALSYSTHMSNCNPPLELLFHTIWYHIAPYGEQWLLLPSMLLSAAAIFLMGLICENLYGKYSGVFAAASTAFSTALWTNAAYEYRSYGFFVFFATLSFYCYIRRNKNPKRKRWSFLFSLALFCMTMTHYFGMVAMAIYFVSDIYLVVKKQLAWTSGSAYFCPGITSLVWLILTKIVSGNAMTAAASWQPVPSFLDVKNLFQFLTGNIEMTYWMLYIGLAIALTTMFEREAGAFCWKKFYCGFSLFAIIGTVSLFFVYGNWINPKSTMWADRYFLFLLPNIAALSALSINEIKTIFCEEKAIRLLQSALCWFAGIGLAINCLALFSSSTSASLSALGSGMTRTTEPYREAADWLYTQDKNVFDEGTVIIITRGKNVLAGWNEYYITRQGRRDPLNTISQNNLTKEQLLNYDKVYVEYWNKAVSSWLKKSLEENYTLEMNKRDIGMMLYVRK